MTQQIIAIFENGVFRPLELVNLGESEQVTITVTSSKQPHTDSETDEEDVDPVWRGVLALPRKKNTLFTKEIPLDVTSLPKRIPAINMNYHRVMSDDD